MGSTAFGRSAPHLRNAVPQDSQHPNSIITFKPPLKTSTQTSLLPFFLSQLPSWDYNDPILFSCTPFYYVCRRPSIKCIIIIISFK